jgi:CheY-like chemotaxis protein
MTNQLLTFSRRQVLQPELVQLNRAIAAIEPFLRRLITEDVEIQIRMADGLGTVKVDPVQMEQVILNLAINARDAMPDGGRLVIETANVELSADGEMGIPCLPPGPYIRLTVSDSGHGMSPEVRSRIFEPFFTTKEKGRGTGLGLSTVYGIIKQSGGQINVESKENRGTTFAIYLPRADEIPGSEKQDDGGQLMDLRGTETVLVVEDDEAVRLFTVTVLRGLGYNVMEARGGPEAIVAAEGYQFSIHLMVTDVVMPRMNGRDLADFMAPKRPAMKVLFVSGYAENVAIGQGNLSPGLSFLSKPFTPETLAQKVRKVLDEPIPKKRVLVIDDEPSVRDLFQHALETSGYDVVTAANGNSALRLLRDTTVDLVVTDLVMPEKEGLETVRELRRDFPQVRILAVSGVGGGQYLRIAKILGADHVMQKPVSPSNLVAKVRELVG